MFLFTTCSKVHGWRNLPTHFMHRVIINNNNIMRFMVVGDVAKIADNDIPINMDSYLIL